MLISAKREFLFQCSTSVFPSTAFDVTTTGTMYNFAASICFAIIFNWIPIADSNNLLSSLQICHRSDPQLNACIQESIENIRPRLEHGIPELFIPSIEPLEVPQIKVDQNSGAIYVHSTYRNIFLYGLSRFTVRDVRIDVNNDKLMLKFWFPSVTLTANYTVNGKIMMLPLYGQGACEGNFSDVDVFSFIRGEKYLRNGNLYYRIKDVIIKYKIGNSNVHLDNLFNGDEALGETMNKFLNENWKTVSSEIDPVIQDAMKQMLRTASERLFEMFPLDQLLPE